MGENELGSLLRATIAVLVFAVIVAFFTSIVLLVIKMSNTIHNSAYEVS